MADRHDAQANTPFFGGAEWTDAQPGAAQEILRRDGIESALRFWTSLTFVEPGQDAMTEQSARSRLLMPGETWRSFFDPDPEQDIEPLLPRVRVPTLVTWGTADRAAPARRFIRGETISRAAPSS